MTALEMQIEVRQSTQKLASNRKRNLQDEELDWILTKMQDRYIAKQLRPVGNGAYSFEPDVPGAEAVRSILKTAPATPYIEPGLGYRCSLPYDYQYLITDTSYVVNLCGTQPTVQTSPLYITSLKQPYTTKAEPAYYNPFRIDFGTGVVINLPTDLSLRNKYTGYNDKADISFLRRYLQLKCVLYWEKIGDVYVQDSYLKATTSPIGGTIGITMDGLAMVADVTTQSFTMTSHPTQGKRTDNRLTRSDKCITLQSSPVKKSSYFSPISELRGESLYVYADDSFTLNRVDITYIKKLLPISVVLGTDSELPEGFHQTICDLATEYIKNELENVQGEQLKERDNQLRNTLI